MTEQGAAPPAWRTAAATALVVLLLGAPVGLLWAAVAPALDLRAVAGGSQSAFRAHLGADLAYLVVTGAAGVGTVLVARLTGRLQRPGTDVGLLLGGAAAAYVAARTGALYRLPDLLAVLVPGTPAEQREVLEFQVRSRVLLAAWPALAACVLVGLRALPGGPAPAPAAARYGEG